MYVRVVRFTGVNAERLEELLARIKESDGPPEGVPTTGLRILLDKDQGTAVVEQYFETAEDMEVGGQARRKRRQAGGGSEPQARRASPPYHDSHI